MLRLSWETDDMTESAQHGWPLVPLGTLAEFRNGINFSKANFGSGIKVIGVGDFQNHVKASFDHLQQINPEGVVRKEHLLKNGDILFVRSNGNRGLIGRSMFVEGLREEVTHSAFSIRLRFVSEACDPRFYAYLFRSPLIRQALSLHGGGTNISNLNQDILDRLQVPLPPKSTQRRIASILASYDNLIENNTRRIKILEQMAQVLYREWFVNFRFPDHEKINSVTSELGPIPAGWTVRKVGDVLRLKYGKALKAEQRTGGSVPVFGSSGVVGYHSQKLASGPGIVVGRKGNVGSVFFCDTDFWVIDTAYFISTQMPLHYVYFNLLSQNFLNNDAAVPGLNRNQAHSLPLVVPDGYILRIFEETVEPIFRMRVCLEKTNSNLRRTRDLLLPKLISGEISVETVEKEAVAQGA
jgi:type I restriction enzyme, S subunit